MCDNNFNFNVCMEKKLQKLIFMKIFPSSAQCNKNCSVFREKADSIMKLCIYFSIQMIISGKKQTVKRDWSKRSERPAVLRVKLQLSLKTPSVRALRKVKRRKKQLNAGRKQTPTCPQSTGRYRNWSNT